MPIRKDKIAKIRELVQQHVDWFIGRVFGTQYTDEQAHVPAPDSVEGIPASLTQMSFVLGKEEAQLKESEWKAYSWGEMVHAAKHVTPEEQVQINAAAFSAYSKFRKLGDDIADGIFEDLAVANNKAVSEAQVRGIIADKIETGVLLGRSHVEVAQDLSAALKDRSRDWFRVAATELHQARQSGVAHAIVNKVGIYRDSDGPDSKVAVVPAPDACRECVRLYLENGKPKVFLLSELLGNAGTNYIRPWRSNAQAVVPPLHPRCYCRLRYVPSGWGWDSEGTFTLVNPEEAFPEAKSFGKSVGMDPKRLSKVRGLASHHSSAESFGEANLGGFGAKNVAHVVSHIDSSSRTNLDLGRVRKKVSDSGNWYFSHKVGVQGLDPHAAGKVTPSGKEDLSKPIVVDHKGGIIDGRHRVAHAQAIGVKELPAYVPAHSMYGMVQKGDDVNKAKDHIPGGIADHKPISKFSHAAIEAGIKVEMEHTDDREIASEIARDHLTEDPKYYDKLKVMEAGDTKKSIDNVPHSLLQGSSTPLPNPEYIKQIKDASELDRLEDRLEKLEQTYITSPEIHKQVIDLIHATRGQRIRVSGILGEGTPNA